MKPSHRAFLACCGTILVLWGVVSLLPGFATLVFILLGAWRVMDWVVDFWYDYFDE